MAQPAGDTHTVPSEDLCCQKSLSFPLQRSLVSSVHVFPPPHFFQCFSLVCDLRTSETTSQYFPQRGTHCLHFINTTCVSWAWLTGVSHWWLSWLSASDSLLTHWEKNPLLFTHQARSPLLRCTLCWKPYLLASQSKIKYWKGERSTASCLLQMTTQDPDNHLVKVAQILILWLN